MGSEILCLFICVHLRAAETVQPEVSGRLAGSLRPCYAGTAASWELSVL